MRKLHGTECALTDFIHSRRILVNRGWIPKDRFDRRTRADTTSDDVVHVVGFLRKSQRKKGIFAPNNVPQQNQWYSIDANEMAAHTGSSPVVLDAAFSGKESYPLGGQGLPELTNPHLNYAITWYSLTAFLAAMSWRVSRGGATTKASESLLNLSRTKL